MLLIEYLTASMVIIVGSAIMLASGTSIISVFKFWSICIVALMLFIPVGLLISRPINRKREYQRVIKEWGHRKDGLYINAIVDGKVQSIHVAAAENNLPINNNDELKCLALAYPANVDAVEHTWRVLTIKDGVYILR